MLNRHSYKRNRTNLRCDFCVDMELPKATNTSALSGAGVMRLFNKVGETVNKITYKMDESDPVSIAVLLILYSIVVTNCSYVCFMKTLCGDQFKEVVPLS